jgi:hypothetical protein
MRAVTDAILLHHLGGRHQPGAATLSDRELMYQTAAAEMLAHAAREASWRVV